MDEPDDLPEERHFDPQQRAIQMADDLRLHAELAAVFEGVRKFDAVVRPDLDFDLTREIQLKVARLEKARDGNNPILPPPNMPDAAEVLSFADKHSLSTNDYHINRRPGEVRIIRWLAGDEIESFYARLQAHFDAGLAGLREDARSQAWKQDDKAEKYAAALDEMTIDIAERHLRTPIRELGLAALSTQAADEFNILFLADHLMGVPVEEIVGIAGAPPDDQPTEQQLAWYFKLFLLRGAPEGVERACFFTFLQKADEEDIW